MIQWSEKVNTKFYGADFSYNDNREEVEFASGRKIFYLKDVIPTKTISVNLALDNKKKIDGLTEFQWFLHWYEGECASGTNPIQMRDLVDPSLTNQYYLDEPPQWKGQKIKVLSLKFREV